MKLLRSAIEEIIGLFVDDWFFAALLVGWVVLFKFLPKSVSPVYPLVFFLGLAAITLFFAVRKARAR